MSLIYVFKTEVFKTGAWSLDHGYFADRRDIVQKHNVRSNTFASVYLHQNFQNVPLWKTNLANRFLVLPQILTKTQSCALVKPVISKLICSNNLIGLKFPDHQISGIGTKTRLEVKDILEAFFCVYLARSFPPLHVSDSREAQTTMLHINVRAKCLQLVGPLIVSALFWVDRWKSTGL